MKKILFMASVVIAMSSCQRNDNSETPSIDKCVDFSYELQTRVLNNKFEESDQISVQAFENDVKFDNIAYYSFVSGLFSSDAPISYASDVVKELSYFAVYPAQAAFAQQFSHEISSDQSTKEKYELSDLLVAHTEPTTSLTPVLGFKHVMSNVIVEVKLTRDGGVAQESDQFEDVAFHAQTLAICDIDEATYVGSGDVVSITPYASSNIYSAIVAPQTIAKGGFLTMKVNGVEVAMENIESTLSSTFRYSIEWVYDIATGRQNVAVSATIDDWADADWGDSGSGDITPEPSTPVELTVDYDGILAAMGMTADDVSPTDGLNVVGAEFEDFTLTSDIGSGTTSFRLWYSNQTIRSASGNTVTITAKGDKKIAGVAFSNSSVSAATVGTVSEGAWTGSADEVTLTLGSGSNTSFAVTVE